MGATTSRELLETPLYNLPAPVAAVHPGFCRPTGRTLQFSDKAWLYSGDNQYGVRDAHTGELCFHVEGGLLDPTDLTTLRDADNTVIAYLRKRVLTTYPSYDICADPNGNQVLHTITVRINALDTHVECTFRDLTRGSTVKVGLRGNWRERLALLWFDQGNGQQLPVARIHAKEMCRTAATTYYHTQDYLIDIAANVDHAFIVFLCIALDFGNKSRW